MHLSALDLLPRPPVLSRLDGGMVYIGGGEDGIHYVPDTQASVDTRPGELEFYPEGSFIKARRPKFYFIRSALPAKRARGAVSGFSRKSRNRLLQNLAKLKRSHLPLFVTMTYPGIYPIHPDEWKKHLDTFSKRFKRRFPNAGFIWKLEPQMRGAPHFHLLAWDTTLTPDEFCAALRGWIKTAWYETVASGDERHLRAGTDVQVVRSWSGVMFYASKYMGKPVTVDDDAWGRPGRWWGAVGRKNIPTAEKLTLWLNTGEVNDLIRWIRRFRNLEGRDCMSRWAVVESPNTWAENVERSAASRDAIDPLAAKMFV